MHNPISLSWKSFLSHTKERPLAEAEESAPISSIFFFSRSSNAKRISYVVALEVLSLLAYSTTLCLETTILSSIRGFSKDSLSECSLCTYRTDWIGSRGLIKSAPQKKKRDKDSFFYLNCSTLRALLNLSSIRPRALFQLQENDLMSKCLTHASRGGKINAL